MSGNLNTALDLLSDSRIEDIWEDTLSNNDEYVSCFKQIDDRLNELHKIVPKESRNALYEIENAVNEIVSISNDLTYKQGFQDGINLLKQAKAGRKPKYFILWCESYRKDAIRVHERCRTGWIYKLVKTLQEYTDASEADQDLARLKSGEISETELGKRRVRHED